MSDSNLARLEEDLHKIPGVSGARVVGEDHPSEIHIVASFDRSPKQIVRDVQSLAVTSFGIPIDHRIVSVVQLQEDGVRPPEPEPDSARRPVVELVLTGAEGRVGWVKVYLAWPDGARTEGHGNIGLTRETRARGAAEAVVAALEPALKVRDARVDVDHILIQTMGPEESVVIRCTFHEKGAPTSLMGTAMVQDDVVGAAVRALLHALNRKLM